ncbi:GAF domain-containing protein [Limibacter armeniacum]|uniref:GAF domain-containing protein n=1 Tax=Limibacter armeniacum TaxID=466084 RepID=UPI002FE5BB83
MKSKILIGIIGVVIFLLSSFLTIDSLFPEVLSFIGLIEAGEERERFQTYSSWLKIIDFSLVLFILYSLLPKYFSVILGAVFFCVTIYVAIDLVALPSTILDVAAQTDDTTRKMAVKAVKPTYYILFVDAVLLLVLLFRLVAVSMRVQDYKIVYVPKYLDKEEDGNSEQSSNETWEKEEAFKKKMQLKLDESDDPLQDFLNGICQHFEIGAALLYEAKSVEGKKVIKAIKTYAYFIPESQTMLFEEGEGLVGQVMATGKPLISNVVPEGYITIASGLGSTSPTSIAVMPLLDSQTNAIGVLELASFRHFTQQDLSLLEELANWMAELLADQDNTLVV